MKKIIGGYVEVLVTKDNYENGEDTNYLSSYVLHNSYQIFENKEEFFEFLSDVGLPKDPTKYYYDEHNQCLRFSEIQNDDGDAVEINSDCYESFKQGKLDLYNADHAIHFLIVEVSLTTTELTNEILGVTNLA